MKKASLDTRYLLLDSTYRDRYLYPEPADYVVPFQKVMGDSINSSVNPSTIQYPIYNFQWTTVWLPTPPSDLSEFKGTIVGGSQIQPVLDAGIDVLIGVQDKNPKMSATFNQLQGVLRQLSFLYDTSSELTNKYIILEYDPINRVATLDRPIPDFKVGKTYTIKNESTRTQIVLQGYDFDRLGQGSNNSGYLISTSTTLYLLDLATQEIQPVQYDGLTTLKCLDGGFGSSWSVSDAYQLFLYEPPASYGVIEKPTASATDYVLFQTIYQWDITMPGDHYMVGDTVGAFPIGYTPPYSVMPWLAVFSVSRVGRFGQIQELTIITPGYGYCCGTAYELFRLNDTSTPVRPIAQIIVSQTMPYLRIQSKQMITTNSYFMPMVATRMFSSNTSKTALTISPTDSIPPTILRGTLDKTKTASSMDLSIQNNVNLLYGTYPIEKVFPLGNNEYGIQIQTGNTEPLMKLNIPNSFGIYPTLYNILNFSADLCVPLNYSGSTVSSSQMVCYGLRIVSLILPNQILYTPFGGLTSAYPFVFVELTNESAPSGHNKITIYANNPNAVNSTFLCHISDVNSPLITKFIKLFSDGSHQTIKFRPNDNLKIRVSLPNGETFTTEETDRLPPLQPNPLLQIVCLVEMVRLE